jgi:hypothetical protein
MLLIATTDLSREALKLAYLIYGASKFHPTRWHGDGPVATQKVRHIATLKWHLRVRNTFAMTLR